MTVDNIIKEVRLCFDEEAVDAAGLAGAQAYDFDRGTHTDIGLMNNIIKSKIGDALRWLTLYAPPELLCGSDTSGYNTDILHEGVVTPAEFINDDMAGVVDGSPSSVNSNRFVLPANFIKLVRVRGTGWHRAVCSDSLIAEDSDDYLKLHDPTSAYATFDRPQVALIEKTQKELECWPAAERYEYTCIVSPSSSITSGTSGTQTVVVPPLAKSSFIYYLAFLTLSAYGDSRANSMLEIAKINIGVK